MGLFDVHAHLTDSRLAAREVEVLDAARAAGVTTIISNGLNPHDNEAVAALAARAPDLVRPAFGLYPVDAVLYEMEALGIDYPKDRPAQPAEEAVEWLEEHLDEAFAMGEIGLDHHWVPVELWERQEAIFRRLVLLAQEREKVIIIHSRRAEARTFEILEELGVTRVDWHCYSGKLKLAKRIAAAGHYLSIPANAVRVDGFQRLLSDLPREQLLLETDCPYLGPDRDVLNEPKNVAGTAGKAAELWDCSVEDAAAQLEENFERLFGVAP